MLFHTIYLFYDVSVFRYRRHYCHVFRSLMPGRCAFQGQLIFAALISVRCWRHVSRRA